MNDTIDLLEAIGQDASLRHASAQDLGKTLQDLGGEDALVRSAMQGDAGELKVSLGCKIMQANQNPPNPDRQPAPMPPPPEPEAGF